MESILSNASIDFDDLFKKYNMTKSQIKNVIDIAKRLAPIVKSNGKLTYASLIMQTSVIANAIDELADDLYKDAKIAIKHGKSKVGSAKKLAGEKKRDMAILISHLLVEFGNVAKSEAGYVSSSARRKLHQRIEDDFVPIFDSIINTKNSVISAIKGSGGMFAKLKVMFGCGKK